MPDVLDQCEAATRRRELLDASYVAATSNDPGTGTALGKAFCPSNGRADCWLALDMLALALGCLPLQGCNTQAAMCQHANTVVTGLLLALPTKFTLTVQ